MAYLSQTGALHQLTYSQLVSLVTTSQPSTVSSGIISAEYATQRKDLAYVFHACDFRQRKKVHKRVSPGAMGRRLSHSSLLPKIPAKARARNAVTVRSVSDSATTGSEKVFYKFERRHSDRGGLNEKRVGKIGDFQPITGCI